MSLLVQAERGSTMKQLIVPVLVIAVIVGLFGTWSSERLADRQAPAPAAVPEHVNVFEQFDPPAPTKQEFIDQAADAPAPGQRPIYGAPVETRAPDPLEDYIARQHERDAARRQVDAIADEVERRLDH